MSDSHEKTKLRRSKMLYILLMVSALLLFAFLWLYLFTDSQLRISKETTYITEPLTADGTRVDYIRALEERTYPPQMQTDDNGCRILTRAIGPPPQITEPELQAQYYEKLGLSPTHTPPLVYMDWEQFFEKYISENPDALEYWKEKLLEEQAANRFTSRVEISESTDERVLKRVLKDFISDYQSDQGGSEPFNAWLRQLEPVLDVLAEAVRKPEFAVPYVFSSDETHLDYYAMMPEWIFYGDLAKSLISRGTHRRINGNTDGAIDDLITCCRLGRHLTKHGRTDDYILGMIFERRAFLLVWEIDNLFKTPVKAEQLRRLFREFDALPDPGPLNELVNRERLRSLSFLQHHIDAPERQDLIKRHWEEDSPESKICGVLGYDWNTIMEQCNEMFDQIPKGTGYTWGWSSAPRDLSWLNRKVRSERLVKETVSWVVSSCENAFEKECENLCNANLQRIVLAMFLYEKEHGTLPPTFSVDSDNKPLHSWRVLLLPYLGYENLEKLHEKIRLDEPWNSEWNRQFHETEIALYVCPGAAWKREKEKNAVKGQTDYTVITGTEMPFMDKTNGEKISGRRTKDFPFDIAMLTERKTPICWMDPTQEIPLTDAEILEDHSTALNLSNIHGGSTNFAFKSGRCESFYDKDDFRIIMRIEDFENESRNNSETLPDFPAY